MPTEWSAISSGSRTRFTAISDHGNFNKLLPFNPTAENIARWIVEQIPECYKATVQESEGNVAIYVADTNKDEEGAL